MDSYYREIKSLAFTHHDMRFSISGSSMRPGWKPEIIQVVLENIRRNYKDAVDVQVVFVIQSTGRIPKRQPNRI
jgi:hypothetical protein